MSAICLFGALCAVNQSVLNSNSGLDLFDPFSSDVNSTYITNVQNPSESPCPSIFRYVQNSDEWHGEVTLENVDLQKDINLRLEITVDNKLVIKHVGDLDLTNNEESTSNQTLVYKVTFPTQNPVPKVKGIYYNEQLICSGPQETANATTTISDRSDLQTSNKKTQPQANKNNRQVEQEPQHQFSNDAECGTLVLGTVHSLSIGGKKISRGEWPWLVAFYGLISKQMRFICGGNLISKMLVITAAHCIQDKDVTIIRKYTETAVYLGKHNLDDPDELGFEERGVRRFIVHPKWNPFDKSYDADIAIIVMDSPVEYSKYIRPICIWEFSEHLHDVIGQHSRMAGWGLNENFVVNSEFPKMIGLKIIDDGTCFRKSPALVPISSHRTFCAAVAKDEGLCKGDSGSGLILKKENKWYLRGLVSASERSKNDSICEPGSLVVFTDVTKFVSWIPNEFAIKPYIESKQSFVNEGMPITHGQFPWIAAFYESDGENLKFTCGGNLISKLHVITAAYCVQKGETKTILETSEAAVFLGKQDLKDSDETGSVRKGIKRFIVHPEWKPFDTNYDASIAIIVMDSPVRYNQYIRPISVWEFSEDLRDVVGQQGTVAGWDLNKGSVLNTEFPKTYELSIMDNGSCFEKFPILSEISSKRAFCAGGTNGENTCIGNGGSGLALKMKNNWYLRGLASTVTIFNGTCVPDVPATFTDVAKFISWIASITGV